MGWVRPITHGWVVRQEVPGPDVDEFAEPDRVVAALAEPNAATRTLLAVQHPHRTPDAIAAGRGLVEALPAAKSTLSVLLRTAYRPIEHVVAPYEVDGPDGAACGVLCMINPSAVGIRSSEQVYPDVVAERAAVLAGLGYATSAAMLVPVGPRDELTAAVRASIAGTPPVVSTVDSRGRRHRMWLNTEPTDLLAAVAAHPLLVADGNHRVAAALVAELDVMLALVTAGPGLRIGAFHRVLTGTGLDATALARAWRRNGITVRYVPGAGPPEVPGTVVVRCPDRTLEVTLPPGIDHAFVEDELLSGALGIDPEGPHVQPLAAGREPPPDADAVLLLAPIPLADVLAEHAAGRRMPRKSTYFTPKPRSGLLLAGLGG